MDFPGKMTNKVVKLQHKTQALLISLPHLSCFTIAGHKLEQHSKIFCQSLF